ncbi:MAG: hypothetical protein ACOYK6_04695 [Chthoniobacterales bacterium]
MFFLTRREQCVITALFCAFLLGLGVKHYRSMHSIAKASPTSSRF